MSPLAISKRLQQASDLRDACIFLAGPRLKKPWGVNPTHHQQPTLREHRAVYPTETRGRVGSTDNPPT
jgi:hypothetical protein